MPVLNLFKPDEPNPLALCLAKLNEIVESHGGIVSNIPVNHGEYWNLKKKYQRLKEKDGSHL